MTLWFSLGPQNPSPASKETFLSVRRAWPSKHGGSSATDRRGTVHWALRSTLTHVASHQKLTRKTLGESQVDSVCKVVWACLQMPVCQMQCVGVVCPAGNACAIWHTHHTRTHASWWRVRCRRRKSSYFFSQSLAPISTRALNTASCVGRRWSPHQSARLTTPLRAPSKHACDEHSHFFGGSECPWRKEWLGCAAFSFLSPGGPPEFNPFPPVPSSPTPIHTTTTGILPDTGHTDRRHLAACEYHLVAWEPWPATTTTTTTTSSSGVISSPGYSLPFTSS